MSGRRLLDIAALFDASRGVVHRHAVLRRKQAEVYGKTSSISKLVQNQTDRVTLTVKAASFLASRLNEDSPVWATKRTGPIHGQDVRQVLRPSSTTSGSSVTSEADRARRPQQESPLIDSTNSEPSPGQSARHISDVNASPHPLPDPDPCQASKDPEARTCSDHKGSPTSLFQSGQHDPASVRSLKQVPVQYPSQVAKGLDKEPEQSISSLDCNYPTESQHISFNKAAFSHPPTPSDAAITQDLDQSTNIDKVYAHQHDSVAGSRDTAPIQGNIPEGINTNVYYSPRIAKILGGRTQSSSDPGWQPARSPSASTDSNIPATSGSKDTSDAQDPSQDVASIDSAIQELEAGGGQPRSPILETTLEDTKTNLQPENPVTPYQLRESKVPSSRIGRLWNYGGLAAGMFSGVLGEGVRRLGGSRSEGSLLLTPGNVDRLVSKLSKMRGAALKLGQMISFQDSKMLPGPIQEVLQRVQDRADYMPARQRDAVLIANLGSDWRDLYSSFDEKPLAAASIGQVHGAVLRSNGARVAVKIQYPGVAESIDSDLNNLSLLLTASRLLPKGLFLDRTIANARTELAWECDYLREADCGRRFEKLLADEADTFIVPKVYAEASGKQVLTTQFMNGEGVTRVQKFSQEQKDWIGTQILRLCLREITEFKFMQTDPNWSNFLFNSQTQKLELLDFGASREFPDVFISKYTQLLAAASKSNKEALRTLSVELGYLSGQESNAMLQAHVTSVMTLAEPFLESSPEIYDFKDQTITERVKELIPLMIRERLNPPPEETYSLHRKLSGAFLLCARLGSRVPCRSLFATSMARAGFS